MSAAGRRNPRIGALALAALLGACSGATVQLKGDIPTPLVEPLPLHMGFYFEPALVEYVYEERIANQGDWRVEVGAMQSLLFLQMGSAMFTEAVEVPAVTALAASVDGVLAPSIVDFQIAIPPQTRTDFYEVWIKYRMRLYNNQGELIAEWPLTAYGKSNQEDFGMFESTREPAMQQATLHALRDAGAFLALGFSSIPPVRAWLNGRGGAAPEAAP